MFDQQIPSNIGLLVYDWQEEEEEEEGMKNRSKRKQDTREKLVNN